MKTSQTPTPAASSGHTEAFGAAAGAYVPPSLCDLCRPAVRVVTDGFYLTITEMSHEVQCLNHPQRKESSAW